MTSRTLLLLVPLAIDFVASCVGDDPNLTTTDPGANDGGPDTGVGDGGGGGEAGPGSDGAACTPGTTACSDGKMLAVCGGPPTPCALDCTTAGGAHCTVPQPAAPVVAADLSMAGVVDVTVAADAFIDTTNGTFDNVRAINDDPTTQDLKGGVGFRLVGNVGVYTMKSLTIPAGVTLKLRGTAAVAIVASDTITIVGVLDARGYDSGGALCTNNAAGPGGSAGGSSADTVTNGNAPGAGGGKGIVGSTSNAGPGGGGYGGIGGLGAVFNLSGGATVPVPTPIIGGFGGGATGGAYGGGGGGAVQLVAGGSIVVGGGANPGGVNAGGCGGYGAAFGQTGAGGGSGGAILAQAPVVSIMPTGVLAANGGAGSTGNASARGTNGNLSNVAAAGLPAISGYGASGNGGAGASPGGGNGSPGASTKGGAGGGGVGHIRIENASGSLSLVAGAVVSPTLSTDSSAAANVGTLSAK